MRDQGVCSFVFRLSINIRLSVKGTPGDGGDEEGTRKGRGCLSVCRAIHNLVPRVFSLSNMAAAGEKTLAVI